MGQKRKFLHHMGLNQVSWPEAANCLEFGGLTPAAGETDCKPLIHSALPGNRPVSQAGADPAAVRAASPTSYMHQHAVAPWAGLPEAGRAPCLTGYSFQKVPLERPSRPHESGAGVLRAGRGKP